MSDSKQERAAIQAFAEREFLAASVAVWREIDRLSLAPEGYRGLPSSTALRQRERKAWERYRDICLPPVSPALKGETR